MIGIVQNSKIFNITDVRFTETFRYVMTRISNKSLKIKIIIIEIPIFIKIHFLGVSLNKVYSGLFSFSYSKKM